LHAGNSDLYAPSTVSRTLLVEICLAAMALSFQPDALDVRT
jgi:hypothetical protein